MQFLTDLPRVRPEVAAKLRRVLEDPVAQRNLDNMVVAEMEDLCPRWSDEAIEALVRCVDRAMPPPVRSPFKSPGGRS